MKKQHPSQQSTPKRSKAKRSRVHFKPPREETPFSKPSRMKTAFKHLRFLDAVYLVFTVLACSALTGMIVNTAGTYRTTKAQLMRHTQQRHQFQTREKSLQQRLAHMRSPDGRDQLLRERGFVRGNERILLFASDAAAADKQNQAVPDTQRTSFLSGVVNAIDDAADRPGAR